MALNAAVDTEVLAAEAPRDLTPDQQRRIESLQARRDRFLYVDSAEAGSGYPAGASGESPSEVQDAVTQLLDAAIADAPEKELVAAQ